MLDYQAVVKSDIATSLLNVSIFQYNKNGEFTGELDADVAITDPANEKTTALTWTAKQP